MGICLFFMNKCFSTILLKNWTHKTKSAKIGKEKKGIRLL